METKEQLINTIREWVRIDNEIRTLQKEQTKRKDEKKKISNSLMNIMKKNEIDVFDINDGQICYTKKNIKKPITKKILMNKFCVTLEIIPKELFLKSFVFNIAFKC